MAFIFGRSSFLLSERYYVLLCLKRGYTESRNSEENSQVLTLDTWQGHLLVLENFKSFQLNHGLMEAGYVNHESAVLSSTADQVMKSNASTASISMTATMDMSGRLVLGKLYRFFWSLTQLHSYFLCSHNTETPHLRNNSHGNGL